MVAEGADLGAAFDGDADRCILADEHGEVRDGDAILYLWATGLRAAGRLEPPRIVATSMSNLGLERALAREGIGIERCDVGDRYVVEALPREGISPGRRAVGPHRRTCDLASTGDGLLTALQIAGSSSGAGRPLSELLAGFRRYPQILQNVRVARKTDFANLPRVAEAARAVEERLGADGRLVPALQRHRAARPRHDRGPRPADHRGAGRGAGGRDRRGDRGLNVSPSSRRASPGPPLRGRSSPTAPPGRGRC